MSGACAVIRSVDIGNATWYYGSRYSYPLTTVDTGGTLAFVDVFKRKGSEPPPHIHHREHEIFVVLTAPTEFQAGADIAVGDVGAVAFLPKGIPHRFAVTQPWAHLAILVTPGGFDEYLAPFSERATHLDMPPMPGELDVQGLIARGSEFGIEFLPPGADLATFPYSQLEGLRPIIRQADEGELLNVLGIPVRVKVSAPESGGAISIFVTEDPAKVGPPLHIHQNLDETLYVLDGVYKVREGDTIRDLVPGQIVHVPRGIAHTYVNAGDRPGKLMVITTPGGFENFFRDVDTICRTGTPSTDAFVAVANKHNLDIVGPPIAV